MAEQVSIGTYGEYSSRNYGANTVTVTVGRLTLWFSYQTCVAFKIGFAPQVVHKNDWAQTTGKHLNWIDGGDKKGRVNGEDFDRLLSEALAEVGLAEAPAVRV